MSRVFRFALIGSVLLHVGVLGGGWLYGRHAEQGAVTPLETLQVALSAQPGTQADAHGSAPQPAAAKPPPPAPKPKRHTVTAQAHAPAPQPKASPQPSPETPKPSSQPVAHDATPTQAAAPAAPAARGAAAVPPGLLKDIREEYVQALRRAITARQRYPYTARNMGEEGTVQVGFTVQADGHIVGLRILQGSGYPELDRAALEAVRAVSPFRPIPAELDRQSWRFTLPMRFALE